MLHFIFLSVDCKIESLFKMLVRHVMIAEK